MSGLLARWGNGWRLFRRGARSKTRWLDGLMWLVVFWLLAGWAGWMLARRSERDRGFRAAAGPRRWFMIVYGQDETMLLWFNLFIFVALLGIDRIRNSPARMAAHRTGLRRKRH
jgi:hypothetical protein